MDISEQKSCLICGTKKPIEAFRSKNGKITAICLQCLAKADDGDQGGGGGFQVNIVDKLAAIALAQEQIKTDAIENFDAVTDRLNEQTERSHQQDNQKKYSSGLFNDKRTGEMFRTTDNKTSQKQTTESMNNKSDTASENSKKESQAEKKTTTTTSTRQNTLFSTSENKQSTNTNQQPITTASPDSSTNKTNTAATRSSLFTTVPSAETLDKASGKSAQQTTNPNTKADNNLDKLATQFIENVLRGPGRR